MTGRNPSGSKTLGCTGLTNEIFAPDPQQTGPTTLAGNAWVGHTLVSGVGTWAYAGTRFERRWQRCNADGESCETLADKTASYVLTPADLGKRLRVQITVDSNAADKLPNPVPVLTPLSDVVTPVPVAPEPTPHGDGGGGAPAPAPAPAAAPADTVAPTLSVKAARAKIKSGAALSLKVTLSEPASLVVEYRKGRKQAASLRVSAAAGTRTLKLPKRKLARGAYRAIIVPVDAAGNRGPARTVKFTVTKR